MHVIKPLSSWNGTLTLVQAAFRHPRRCSFIISRLDRQASLVSPSVAYMSRGCLIFTDSHSSCCLKSLQKLQPMSRPCLLIFTDLPVLRIIPAHAPVANVDKLCHTSGMYSGWDSWNSGLKISCIMTCIGILARRLMRLRHPDIWRNQKCRN
jgi:hypothetical protein